MKKLFNARRGIAGTLAVMMALSNAQVPAYAQTERSGLVGKINLDPQTHYQTLEGWGTSLCWWGNVIGSAGDRDTDGNGISDREDIAKLAFSPDYLNLNIVRYNVGGGDKPESSIKRVEGLVPGWSVDMYGEPDGSGEFLGDDFYNKPIEEMNDAGQIWMMQQANEYRKAEDDIINEVFSNSPPYYMTKSGSSTGGNDWDKENLDWNNYDQFTSYLARATKWLDQNLETKYGTGVDYVEPLNEPDTNYWINGSTKQEGCIFSPGESQIRIYNSMERALENEGLTDVKMTGTDETSLWNAKNSFEKLDADTRKSLSVIGAHTYSGSDSERVALKNVAASYDKPLWMSEITRGGGTHNDNSHESMWDVNAKDQSRGIMSDLKKMQASAWIAWLVADSEYECLQTGSSWGLLHYVFEDDGPVPGYHTNLLNGDGTKKEGVPDAGYWAVTKQFYTMMQYSKYLKAGYTMVEIGDGNMCAAVSPDRTELVIVAQNFESGARNTSVDLRALPAASKVELYRTSDAESCELINTETLTDNVLNVNLPDNSVSTYVITAEDGRKLYDVEGYKQIVDCDAQATADTFASGAGDNNKFTYDGSWGTGWGVQEKYTTNKGDKATFKFTGTQAAIYGKKSENGAELSITIDDEDPQIISAYASSESRRSLLYMTPVLKDGDHTVTVTMAENQTAGVPEIVLEYAEIMHGSLAAETPVITDVAAHDGKLIVYFNTVEGVAEYTVEYGTDGSDMQTMQVQEGKAILTGLTNGVDYDVRVKIDDSHVSVQETARPVKPDEDLFYFVNAGTGLVRAPYGDEAFGTFNGVMDQVYGEDAVTGKRWGYVADEKVYSHVGEDASIWNSVRYGGHDEPGKGVIYKFQLDPGEYVVQVGMSDPWTNSGRKQDIVLQGEMKESLVPKGKITKKYIATVGEDGLLTLEVLRSAGITDGQCDPLLNWIKIEKPANDNPDSIDPLPKYVTINGIIPNLPLMVNGKNSEGETVSKPVVWDVSEEMFKTDAYSTVHVTGSIEGSALEATADVLVVPSNLQYFVDCNNVDSPTYEKLKDLDLQNEVADQKYTDGSWGYVEDYGENDSENGDRLDSGWYAYENQNIAYKLPLKADDYTLTFGFKEWWAYDWRSRPMVVTASYEGEDGTVTETLCEVKLTGDNQIQIPVVEFALPRDAEVTFTVSKSGNDDPLLSFFSIQQKRDHSALTSALAQARAIDRSKYAEARLETLDAAVLAGYGVLVASEIAQSASAEAAKAVTDAIAALDSASGLTKEELLANNLVLYTANCGTSDPTVVPNSDNERMGLLQSSVDQPLGADPETGRNWGYDPDTEYSKMKKHSDNATDIGYSFAYMAEDITFDKYKSALGYTFEVPTEAIEGMEEDTYEVTVAFKHYWDDRAVNIALEGRSVATDLGVGYGEWVSRTFITKVTDGSLNVRVSNPRRNGSKQDPILNFIKVRAVEEREPEIPVYDSITGVNGDTMYDTNGNQIQAHGGQIQQLTVDGATKYYWIGEDKTTDYRPVGGIHMYSSTDLYNWDDEGVVLRTMDTPEQFETDEYFKSLYGDYSAEKQEEIFVDLDTNSCVMERPKIIYNEKNDNYVIWFHADGRYPGSDADYGKAKGAVAISDSPTGPFKLLGSYKLNYHDDPNADHGYDGWGGRGSLRDMNLFVDDDKTAYIIYSSEGNKTMFVSKLNEDYTDLVVPREEAVEGVDFTRNFVGWSREAPAMFKYLDKYYVITSGCTGWSPNPGQYAVADHPMGPWTSMGDPCDGWDSNTTFYTQPTCVIPVDAANGKFIYMGDRWNAGDLSESRYVWIPIEFMDGDRLVLKRYENWKLEELDNKGLATIQSEIPKEFESLEELKAALPEVIDVRVAGADLKDAAVTWENIDTEKPFLGEYQVIGTLTQQNRRVSHMATIRNTKTQYFFDSGAENSKYFDLLQEAAQGLRNEKPDQTYTAENHAGYLGTEKVDFGVHSGQDLFGNGLWAEKNKVIEYAFDLMPGEYTVTTGYQEWWNTKRSMKLSAVVTNANGTETVLDAKTFTLGNEDRNLVQELKFTVPETTGADSPTIIRVEKTGSSDPVLSFISIVPTQVQEMTYSIAGTVSGEDTDDVEDITIHLYSGDISMATASNATPSNAVKTDADGKYRFRGLEDGIYSVEIPEENGYKRDVKVVEVKGKNELGIDFTLVKGEADNKETELKIKTLPAKKNYWVGEALDPEGLEVALYQNGQEMMVLDEEEYTLSELDSTSPGRRKITVTYTMEENGEIRDYEASFQVTVHEKPDSSIKIVKKPNKLSYLTGETLDVYGMEVRGLNLAEEPVVILQDGDYEVVYDFTEPGTKKVTVIYTLEDQEGLSVELEDSFEVKVFDGEEARTYVEQIKIAQKPHKLVYEAGEDFDGEGMVVKKTVHVIASSSNATYEETIPFEELDLELDDFTKTGSRKVKILFTAEGKDGEEKEFTTVLTVTVSKSQAALVEGNMNALKNKLEEDLIYGDYLTKEEKQTAVSGAVDSAKIQMEVAKDNGGVSTKVFEILKDIEKILLNTYENVTTSVKADNRFANVSVDGLALSADLESEKAQQMQLQIGRTTEEIPADIIGETKARIAMDILLNNGESEIQPELPIRIRMDIPAGLEKNNLVIYHYHDGEWETIVPVVSGGQMSFIVSELSVFVAANKKEQPKPSTSYDDDDDEASSTIPGTWKKDATGWWYQKSAGGYIRSSWAQINGQWYYFDDIGYMKTGWVLDKATWYYLKDDGSMAAGTWILTNEKWYYVTRNGDMAVNTTTPDGFKVGGDGGWIQ